MKKSRFTEAQIVAILKELDAGTAATELARRHGLHANTIRQWRDKYAGLENSDLTRLKQDKVTFESHVRIDSLGQWQEKLLDAIRQHMKGAVPQYALLPFGRAGLVVYWDGFKGLSPTKRQEAVKEAIETLGPSDITW